MLSEKVSAFHVHTFLLGTRLPVWFTIVIRVSKRGKKLSEKGHSPALRQL